MSMSVLHPYSEQSARSKLARHRGRGDDNQVMRLCDICGQWHVGESAELLRGVCVNLVTGDVDLGALPDAIDNDHPTNRSTT